MWLVINNKKRGCLKILDNLFFLFKNSKYLPKQLSVNYPQAGGIINLNS
jgi:hypothetical protein